MSAPVLELGALPPCNRFASHAGDSETYPLAMTACGRCGLVQLSIFPAFQAIVPPVPWIRYTEPDTHLDDLVSRLRVPFEKVFGLGPFDLPLLARLAGGRARITPIEVGLLHRAGGGGAFPYLETLQDSLRGKPLDIAARQHGRADLVVLRYLLEHSHDPLAMLRDLKAMVAPGGALLIEVPDSTKFLSRDDYSFIWEEHICYFTEQTLRRLAAQADYEMSDFFRYEGPLEDALVALLRPAENLNRPAWSAPADDGFSSYRQAFPGVRDAYRQRLESLVRSGSRVALVGIGHQALMFLNALKLQPFVAMLVDDDPNKIGCFAPGAASAICPSSAFLADRSIDTCLLAVNPRSEAKLKERVKSFADRGGRFFSIYPGGGTPTLAEAPWP